MSKNSNSIYERLFVGFLAKSEAVHGNRYDYSEVKYVNNKVKIKIICGLHGLFEQRPSSHLRGAGCPTCSLKQRSDKATNNRSNTAEFIQKAEKVHNKFYNYSKTKYIKALAKVQIVCPIHGIFEQKANAHLNGQGCPKCRGGVRLTTAVFVENATKIHNSKFDYSLVEYVNSLSKVKIICPIHGVFEQTPHDHLSGRGCSNCGAVGFKYNLPGLLYYMIFKHNNEYYFKIGITNRTIKKRFVKSDRIKIVAIRFCEFGNGKDAYDKEQKILKEYKDYIYNGDNRILKYNEDNNANHKEFFIKDVLNKFEQEIENGLEHLKPHFL